MSQIRSNVLRFFEAVSGVVRSEGERQIVLCSAFKSTAFLTATWHSSSNYGSPPRRRQVAVFVGVIRSAIAAMTALYCSARALTSSLHSATMKWWSGGSGDWRNAACSELVGTTVGVKTGGRRAAVAQDGWSIAAPGGLTFNTLTSGATRSSRVTTRSSVPPRSYVGAAGTRQCKPCALSTSSSRWMWGSSGRSSLIFKSTVTTTDSQRVTSSCNVARKIPRKTASWRRQMPVGRPTALCTPSREQLSCRTNAQNSAQTARWLMTQQT